MGTTVHGFAVFGAIEEKWRALGGPQGALKLPTTNETPTFDNVGRYQHFQGGIISWHPEIGAHVVWGMIGERWLQIGREQFGYPITDEVTTPDGRGRFNHFRALHLAHRPESSIYWTPETAAQEIYGAIRAKWAELGWETGALGYPVGPEASAFDNVGRYQHFQGGIISWHAETGAHVVWGKIGERWLQIGREQFGYPITDETTTPDGRGRFNHFRALHLAPRPEASIYWTPETGAQEIYGGIRAKWAELGWETGALGYPLGPEAAAFDNVGRYQHFQGGMISWQAETGAHVVWGKIGERWLQIGREQFGYPITDETTTPDGRGRFNHFRALHLAHKPESSIYWTPETGAHEIYGGIRDRWARRGWEQSGIGYPVGPEKERGDGPGREQRFEHGRIVWTAETGALFDPLAFTRPIVTGGLAALGGWITISVNLDGSVRWSGHAHNSGADGYDFGISALVRSPSGRAMAFAHSGYVGGTLTAGGRDDDWEELNPPTGLVSRFLADYNDAQFESQLEYSSDIGATLESAVNWLVKWGVGTLLSPVGAVVFVGCQIGSLISTGSLVPGARLAGGILWMAGPANSLLAIAADGIASLGSRTRELTAEEYDWANREVFLGALPPRDRLVLTDTIGGGNRAFVFPRFDGKITINMGNDGFDDPRNYDVLRRRRGGYGHTFIHELVHTCQIQHTSMDLALLADAFASKICEATGGNPYAYGPAGPPYSEFNLEQQAQIVADWFIGSGPAGSNHTGDRKDLNSPYFRYVSDVRAGNL